MGTKLEIAGEMLEKSLAGMGDVRLRKMFGGYGVFEEEKMFALIDKAGNVFFKADESNLSRFEEAGSEKHVRMPYYRVPDEIIENEESLRDWATDSIKISKK